MPRPTTTLGRHSYGAPQPVARATRPSIFKPLWKKLDGFRKNANTTCSMTPDRAQWEIRNEKNKTSVRWVLIATVGSFLVYRFLKSSAWQINFDGVYLFSALGFAILANTAISLLVARAIRRGLISTLFKYATMTLDFFLVALALVPTGGGQSLLYPLNYVVIVSNALRYGMGVAITGAIIMNFFYVLVLAYQHYPQTEIPDFQQHALKLAGFWLVGIYTGYLSRRYEVLRGEVERLQKLLGEALKKNG